MNIHVQQHKIMPEKMNLEKNKPLHINNVKIQEIIVIFTDISMNSPKLRTALSKT